jgi:hypothetical protein
VLLRHDLDTAGVAYRDEAGRVADFHAFHHTFISMISQGGPSVKVAKELARHSTPTLTIGRYAHASVADQTVALSALPSLATLAAQPSNRRPDRLRPPECHPTRPSAHQMRTKLRLSPDGLSPHPTRRRRTRLRTMVAASCCP